MGHKLGTQAPPRVRSLPRLPEHLQRRDGVYHFRMRIPDSLRAIVGKREFRQSLKTSNLAEAKQALAIQRLMASAELQDARRKIATPAMSVGAPERPLTEVDLWSLAVSWFVEKQKADAQLRPADFREEDRLQELAFLTNPDDTNTLASVRNLTKKFISSRGFQLDTETTAFRRLEALLHEGMIEREKRIIRRFVGANAVDLSPRFEGIDETTDRLPRTECTLSELIARFEADAAKRTGNAKSKLKRQAHYRVLKELLTPTIAVQRISREEARRVCAAIAQLPSNFTKRYPGMTVPQVLQRDASELGPTMSPATVNDYVRAFSALMDFAVNEHLIERNPTKKLLVASDGIKAKYKRLPFSIDDLNRIFSAPLYSGCVDDENGYSNKGPNRPRRGRFWVPLIGLFSGMRLNEICQLVEDDIAHIAGHDVFLVQPSEDGSRRVKTEAAERVIPIHPELKRLGFLEFVDKGRRAGAGTRLFPDLAVAKTGYASDNFSKWFARFLDHVGIDHPRKNFHSLRHCFRDALRAGNVPLERAQLLGGWTRGDTDARYGGSKEVEADLLSAEIGKVAYQGLTLDLR